MSFLLFFSIFSFSLCSISVCAQCQFGCPNLPGLIAYNSVDELNCAMESEAAAVTAGFPIRSPPYRYILCPNTSFDVTIRSIEPVINETVIQCGESGELEEDCVVRGDGTVADIDLSLIKARRYTENSVWPVAFQMYVRGIKFVGNNNAAAPSVAATALEGNEATFRQCQWENRSMILDNSDERNRPAMHVTFEDCVIQVCGGRAYASMMSSCVG